MSYSNSRVQLLPTLSLHLLPQSEGLLHHMDIIGLAVGLPGDTAAAMGTATRVLGIKLQQTVEHLQVTSRHDHKTP